MMMVRYSIIISQCLTLIAEYAVRMTMTTNYYNLRLVLVLSIWHRNNVKLRLNIILQTSLTTKT